MLAEGLRGTEGIRAVLRLLIIPRQLPYTQGSREQIQSMEKQSLPHKGGLAKTKILATYWGSRVPGLLADFRAPAVVGTAYN
jgi:hypothetical protein